MSPQPNATHLRGTKTHYPKLLHVTQFGSKAQSSTHNGAVECSTLLSYLQEHELSGTSLAVRLYWNAVCTEQPGVSAAQSVFT